MAKWVVFVVGLVGCAPEPVCGVDNEENERPVCTYELEKGGATIDYCPGDEWGAVDGCNSCGCDATGEILCTQITCPAATEN